MGREQRTPKLAYSCGIRFEESMYQYRIKCTYDYGAAFSMLAGVGTNILEVGDICRDRALGCK